MADSGDDNLENVFNQPTASTPEELRAERQQIFNEVKRIHRLVSCLVHQGEHLSRDLMVRYVNRISSINFELNVPDNDADSKAIYTMIKAIGKQIKEDEEEARQSLHNQPSSPLHSTYNRSSLGMNSTFSSVCSHPVTNDPNVTVEPWDGTAIGYYKFEKRFKSTYSANPVYSASNRFAAFSKLIGPKGRAIIVDLEETTNGLITAMDRIRERFGHKSQVRADIERQLAAVPAVKSKQDAPGMSNLIGVAEMSYKVLTQSGTSTDYLETVVFATVGSKLPHQFFQTYLKQNNSSKDLKLLIQFIRTQVEEVHNREEMCRAALVSAPRAKVNGTIPEPATSDPTAYSPKQSKNRPVKARSPRQQLSSCRLCDGNHHVFQCNYGTAEQRKQLATNRQWCLRCLLRHPAGQCRSRYLCQCGEQHSQVVCTAKSAQSTIPLVTQSTGPSGATNAKLLYQPPKEEPKMNSAGITMSVPRPHSGKSSSSSSCLQFSRPDRLTSYFETVVVSINGQKLRIQLDSGSGRTLILKDVADRLNLKPYAKHKLNLGGFDGLSSQTSERLVKARVQSLHSNQSFSMIMCVTPVIDHRPRAASPELWTQLKDLGYELSDSPEHDQLPISILVGTEYYWKLFTSLFIPVTDEIAVRNSIFGWTMVGTTEDSNYHSPRRQHSAVVGLSKINLQPDSQPYLDDELPVVNFSFASSDKPSKLESAASTHPSRLTISNDDQLQEEYLQEFIKANVHFRNGRYSVNIPCMQPLDMKDNKTVALNRFYRLERGLEARGLKPAYDAALAEMVANFTEPAPDVCKSAKCYYMPHHPVIRLDKDTTKLRVVFDASSHSSSTKSLNDNLFKGVVNWDLFDVLLRFRFGQHAVTADIEKAFLRIQVEQEDRDAFRFWWRDPDGNLNIRRFTAVPFGTSISPGLLFAVLKHLFDSNRDKYPDVVPIIENRMYVDDVVVAFQDITPSELEAFRARSIEMFKTAGMNLCKFRTNHHQLDLQWAGPSAKPVIKVLGHAWNLPLDKFSPAIDIDRFLTLNSLTKREFTAFVQSVYNPTGIVAPFCLILKLALRELWKLKLRWDDTIPESELRHALKLINEAKLVNEMVAPRNVWPDEGIQPTLRVYADASTTAVGIAVYCCSTKGNFLIFSKSKLARTATIPELELDALVMAAAVSRQLSLAYPFSTVVICGDSKLNLQRLIQHPNKQKLAVALRVNMIKRSAPHAVFRHVESKENMADIVSRGATMTQLLKSKHWLEAPELSSTTQFEHTVTAHFLTVAIPKSDCTCTQYRNYSLAVNCYRIIARLLKKKKTAYDDIHELDLALILLIRDVQRRHFEESITTVDEHGTVTFDHCCALRNYAVHRDGDQILRLRTRLQQTVDLSFDEVHPVILPAHCHFSRLVIANTHHQLFHPGVDRTNSTIRQRYFIINQKRMVKHFVNHCQICRRKRHSPISILHGPVPSFRYDIYSPPFTNTGIDLFGPIKLPMEDNAKFYGIIYSCATSRLVYLDVVKDMTAKSVFESVSIFITRNGLPRIFYSDNGKQLVKVKKDLQEYLEQMSQLHPDREYRFKWLHLTAHSPWKGGFYERLIRSIKDALCTYSLDPTISVHRIASRVNGKRSKLSFEHLKLVMAEIEAMINNRPLFVHEDQIIRPVDFLAGKGSAQMPISRNLPSSYQKPNLIRDYKAFQKRVNKFREMWKTHYILELRNFHQHKERQTVPRKFEVGDVVHVKKPNTAIDSWPLGIVIKTFANTDGITRSVSVRTLNRGNITEEVKDVRNLIPVEANNERHEDAEPPPAVNHSQADISPFEPPTSRLRSTASRTTRQQANQKKESLDRLAKKWSKQLQSKRKDAIRRQSLRDQISSALANGTSKGDPLIQQLTAELYSLSTDRTCHSLSLPPSPDT